MDKSKFGSTENVRFCLPTRGCAVTYLPSTPIKTYSKSSTITDSWEANGKVPVFKGKTKKHTIRTCHCTTLSFVSFWLKTWSLKEDILPYKENKDQPKLNQDTKKYNRIRVSSKIFYLAFWEKRVLWSFILKVNQAHRAIHLTSVTTKTSLALPILSLKCAQLYWIWGVLVDSHLTVTHQWLLGTTQLVNPWKKNI